MRTWIRTPVAVRCGKCGSQWARGAIVQIVSMGGANWRLVRCQLCAEGKPPAGGLPELPSAADVQTETLKLT